MPLKGVIYDLDGTLIDSRDDLADSVNAMLARLSIPEREPQTLRGLGVESAFRAVVGGDEAPRMPAPDGLLRICATLGARPQDALLVGDSAVDLATGKAAGVPVCAVTWGLGERAELASADYLCDTPMEVGELLARLRS